VRQQGDGGGGVADAAVEGLGPGYGRGWDTTSELQDRPLGYWRVLSCYTLRVWGRLAGVSPGFYFSWFADLEGKEDKHLGM
jgi:hypothetical protein